MLALRDRSKKKDTQLRKKAAKELNRSKMVVGQVAKLPTGSTLHQAAQLMAAQRADAVLVVSPGNSDTPGKLLGILTDRDIVNRAVAIGVSITVPITQVMTRDPVAVPRSTPFGEALQLMIARKFRHLPMVDSMNGEPQSPVGILDIAQCVLSRLADLEKKVQEDSSVRQAMEVLRRNGDLPHDVATMLAARHSCPTIKEIIRDSTIPEVSVRVSVKEAAQVMKLNHSTGVLVMSSDHGVDSLAGILTTKDIVLRVLAADLDPNTTSVVRVMTPRPDTIESTTSILEALKKMNTGHYRHLPVQERGVLVGLVDVQQLALAVLDYFSTDSSGVSTRPMWNEFWNEADDTETLQEPSVVKTFMSSVFSPKKSTGSVKSMPVAFTPKKKDPVFVKLRDATRDKTYRFSHSPEDSTAFLMKKIKSKLGLMMEQPFFHPMAYLDEERDYVSISSESDLKDALQMCFRNKNHRLLLHYGEYMTDGNWEALDFEDDTSTVTATIKEASIPVPVSPPSLLNAQNGLVVAGSVVIAAYIMSRFL